MVKKATAVSGSFGRRVLDNKAIVALLLREHRRVVRVIQQRRATNYNILVTQRRASAIGEVPQDKVLCGSIDALDDLLAALRGERT